MVGSNIQIDSKFTISCSCSKSDLSVLNIVTNYVLHKLNSINKVTTSLVSVKWCLHKVMCPITHSKNYVHFNFKANLSFSRVRLKLNQITSISCISGCGIRGVNKWSEIWVTFNLNLSLINQSNSSSNSRWITSQLV